ncbi:receptor-like protein kinase ANXUR2 isoform X2 [Dioscorea cayenensis subsp. rotundata]|uniref:non-specific serine/threonine protein kinase n=1 Tax=Dioscorea cayennensis subsp. rotundata TaxID=55577 RepID=A0AB40CSW3_DIOCR|nr:receptor-like protein kinase ANXUR2 isoform X2 [Dioscorea cayenensis subsp. rotundata]
MNQSNMRSRHLLFSSSSSPISTELATQNTRGSPNFPSKELWAGFLVTLVAMVAGVVLFTCLKRQCLKKWKKSTKGVNLRKLDLRRFHLEELQKATMSFNKECLLGSGAFGNVYKGVFDNDQVFAIKKSHQSSYQTILEFRNEVELLSRVKHSNLVGLEGYCDQQRRRKPLTWRQRVNIAIGAAKGIAHLHEGVKPSIIHRDIKPSNILIGEDFEAKVSDFGLVKSGPMDGQSHVSSQIKGTPGYLDPSYCASYHLTPFSDVYSFGIILLQLVTARPAVASTRSQSRYHIIDWARASLEKGNVADIIDANLLTEPCNMDMMLKMGQLGLKCVIKSPKNRPTMIEVVRELEEALEATKSYECKQEPRVSSHESIEKDEGLSFSINGIGLEKFQVENDGLSINSASMQCFDVNSIILGERDDLKIINGGNDGAHLGTSNVVLL